MRTLYCRSARRGSSCANSCSDGPRGIYSYSSDPRVTRYLFFGPRDSDSTAEYLEELIESQRERPRTRFELAVMERIPAR